MKKENDIVEFDIDGLKLCVSGNFRFGTDAVLLSKHAAVLSRHTVCDLCAGSGIVSFMLYKDEAHRPHKIYSLDIAREAHALLTRSLELNNITDTIIPIQEDLRNITQIPRESVDIVTVNPPYFKKGSGAERKSPSQAAARHELTCTVEDAVKAAAKLLKFGGRLVMCQLPNRMTDVIAAMRNSGIEPKKLLLISSQKKAKTEPWLFIINGKKGAKSGLAVEHTYTEEALGTADE